MSVVEWDPCEWSLVFMRGPRVKREAEIGWIDITDTVSGWRTLSLYKLGLVSVEIHICLMVSFILLWTQDTKLVFNIHIYFVIIFFSTCNLISYYIVNDTSYSQRNALKCPYISTFNGIIVNVVSNQLNNSCIEFILQKC